MANQDPRQEAIQVLSRFLNPSSKDPAEAEKTRAGFRFLREKTLPTTPGRMIMAVTNEVRAQGQLQVCYLEQNERGEWRYSGGASSSLGGVSAYPRVVLGGGGWPRHFHAGGYVISNGVDIARVHLVAADGEIIADTVEDGIVLFLTDQPVSIPMHAELFDHSDTLVEQHNAFY